MSFRIMSSFVVGFLVFFMSEFGFADPTYGKVGGSAVLDPGKKFDSISSVTWKHRTDLALEWFGGEITCYRTFEGRCELNKTTGRFTITNLTSEDSGEYTPEINNSVLSKKELKLIEPVPKPTVTMDCNKEKTNCNLTCAANMMSEFGPVTYEWKTGEKVFSTNKELSLTEKNKESSFFCILRNPISNSTSDDFPNPIIRENNIVAVTTWVVIGVLLIMVVVGLGVGAYVMYKKVSVPRVRTMYEANATSRKETKQSQNVETVYDEVSAVSLLTRRENEFKESQNVETVYDKVSAVSLRTRREND